MVPLRLVGLLVGLEGGACLHKYSKGTVLSSLLQGHPSSLRFGHPDVTTGDAACLRGYSKGTVLSSLLQGLGEGTPHISSAPTQGHPSHRRSASPCFAAESVCTTP